MFPHKNERPCSRAGFTLIELLLVVSLLSVTGIAVYQAIAAGVKVWETSRRYSGEEDLAVFLERLTADLQNTVRMADLAFDGKAESLVIPTIVRTPVDKKISASGDMTDSVGAVQYYLQKGKRTVFRRQANYGLALKKKYFLPRPLVTPVSRLRLTYFVQEDGKLVSRRTISREIPASVLVEVDFLESGGGIRTVQKLINIPVGGSFR